MSDRRLAVIDLGSNSFRLVVFTWGEHGGHGWWRRTDEIHEAVRVGQGLDAAGELQPEPMERALETIELFAHFCRATGIDDVRPVATSAIRDATNQAEFLKAARKRSGLEVEVLSPEDEARYGYLAAVNSTTLADGVALDLGGGSMQLSFVEDREARDMRSWPLGAVRMTERFFGGDKVKGKQVKALRAHLADELADAGWLPEAGRDGARLAGIGGTVRNLGAAAELAADLPSFGVQGFLLTRKALDDLVERFADMSPEERGEVPGIKPERGDLILAGAVTVQSVMEIGAFEALEVTEAGLREGVFYSTLLEGARPAAVRGRAAPQRPQPRRHLQHRLHPRRARRPPRARDVGRARRGRRAPERPARARPAVGGVDAARHRHRGRLRRPPQALALPDPQRRPARLHDARDRADRPDRPLPPQGQPVARASRARSRATATRPRSCAAAQLVRLGEQLERSRDQSVHEAHVGIDDGHVELRLEAEEDVTIARWAAQRQRELFKRAFGRELNVSD